MSSQPRLSVVLPAKNEAASVGQVVAGIRKRLPDAEVLVVDDGSTDDTGAQAQAAGARVIRHPVSRGNGAAVKSGARHARGALLIFMDADGQHDPEDCARLLSRLGEGYDMVVGARTHAMHSSALRLFGNTLYNRLASWITGTSITDLTSGFRAARADLFRQFLPLLPNGFSYPTTITMAFLRAGYGVAFEPVQVRAREDRSTSHIRLFRDGGRFLLIIFRVGTLYSPLKIFFPVSMLFGLAGSGYVGYTLLSAHRFTNGGALMFVTSLLVFFMGLISEQITQLLYSLSERDSAPKE